MCKFYATRHLAQRIGERLAVNASVAEQLSAFIQAELNAGRYSVLHNHKDTGFIALVDGITCDVRPEQNGARAVSTVFYKVNQWVNRQYAKKYWPLVHKGWCKDKAHNYVMSVLLPK